MIRAAACLHFAVMRPSGCARCKAAARSFSVGHWTHTDGHQRPSKFGARAAPQDLLQPLGILGPMSSTAVTCRSVLAGTVAHLQRGERWLNLQFICPEEIKENIDRADLLINERLCLRIYGIARGEVGYDSASV